MPSSDLGTPAILLIVFGVLLFVALSVILCSMLPKRLMRARLIDNIELERVMSVPEKLSFQEYEDSPENSPTSSKFPNMKQKSAKLSVKPILSGQSSADGSPVSDESRGRKVHFERKPVFVELPKEDGHLTGLGSPQGHDEAFHSTVEDAVWAAKVDATDPTESQPASPSSPCSPCSPKSPVDCNGRRNKKSVVPGELPEDFLKQIAEAEGRETVP